MTPTDGGTPSAGWRSVYRALAAPLPDDPARVGEGPAGPAPRGPRRVDADDPAISGCETDDGRRLYPREGARR